MSTESVQLVPSSLSSAHAVPAKTRWRRMSVISSFGWWSDAELILISHACQISWCSVRVEQGHWNKATSRAIERRRVLLMCGNVKTRTIVSVVANRIRHRRRSECSRIGGSERARIDLAVILNFARKRRALHTHTITHATWWRQRWETINFSFDSLDRNEWTISLSLSLPQVHSLASARTEVLEIVGIKSPHAFHPNRCEARVLAYIEIRKRLHLSTMVYLSVGMLSTEKIDEWKAGANLIVWQSDQYSSGDERQASLPGKNASIARDEALVRHSELHLCRCSCLICWQKWRTNSESEGEWITPRIWLSPVISDINRGMLIA